MIRENPYMQYFLGLEAFTYEQVMTPSLLVSIRKRIDLDVFESLTDDLIRKGLELKAGAKTEFGAKINISLLDDYARVDKIYLTRENRRFLKEKAISYTGEPLGRKLVKRSGADTGNVKSEGGKRQNATRLKGILGRASVDMV